DHSGRDEDAAGLQRQVLGESAASGSRQLAGVRVRELRFLPLLHVRIGRRVEPVGLALDDLGRLFQSADLSDRISNRLVDAAGAAGLYGSEAHGFVSFTPTRGGGSGCGRPVPDV